MNVARVSFATKLDRASMLRRRGFASAPRWIPLQGTKRLTVGTGAFLISAPEALQKFAFRGHECSIAISQAPSRFASRDWIVIAGQSGDRQVQVAIAPNNVPETWQALAATGPLKLGPEAAIISLERRMAARRTGPTGSSPRSAA